MLYLAAFAAALLVDTIPVFAPPAWTILAHLPPERKCQHLVPWQETRRAIWYANIFVMLYAISPLSTTALFTAAGMAHVNPWNILPGFAIGKFLDDAWVILMAKATADEATELLHGDVSWQTALTAAAGLLLISCVLFIDWRQLLGHKKFRLNFKIWKQ